MIAGLEDISAGTLKIGEAAATAGVVLHELTPVSSSLEEAYMTLTQDEVEYRAGGVPAASQGGAR